MNTKPVLRSCKVEIGILKVTYTDSRPLKAIRRDILKDIVEITNFTERRAEHRSDDDDEPETSERKHQTKKLRHDNNFLGYQ